MDFFHTLPKSVAVSSSRAAAAAAAAHHVHHPHAAAAAAAAAGLAFVDSLPGAPVPGVGDKRNRNPNWTDAEIIRFLEILQEEETLKDLLAQRNKTVFCYVAQRLCAEGAPKTWDQCRIKLKNLKSQYRYIKERIPAIEHMDLDDEDTNKKLVHECQGRGISPSNLKHLRYLRRFLNKINTLKERPDFYLEANAANSQTPTGSPSKRTNSSDLDTPTEATESKSNVGMMDKNYAAQGIMASSSMQIKRKRERSVSPPPMNGNHLRVVDEEEQQNNRSTLEVNPDTTMAASAPKRLRSSTGISNNHHHLNGNRYTNVASSGTQHLLEKFNTAMMEQLLAHQRQTQASFLRWEAERQRQHEIAMERWRQQNREHERQMLGLFVQVLGECNRAFAGLASSNSSIKGRSRRAYQDEDLQDMDEEEEEALEDDIYGLEPHVTLKEQEVDDGEALGEEEPEEEEEGSNVSK